MNITKAAATITAALALSTTLGACDAHQIANDLHSATTNSAATTGTGTYRLIQEPQAGMDWLPKQIDGAHTSVSMEMYSLHDADTQNALITAHQRGVTVHVLLDAAFGGTKFNASAYQALTRGGVDVHWAPKSVIYHVKTTVIDNTTADISTSNLNAKDYATYRDATIVDTNPSQVHAITSMFDQDYAGGNTKDDTATADGLVVSPYALTPMLNQINSATRSIRFSSEELANHDVVDALAGAAQRGVKVHVLMTDDTSWDSEYDQLRAAGATVSLLPKSASVYIHEKILLTDDHTLTIGSQNCSTSSLTRNREVGITLTDQAIVKSVASTFDTDSKDAQ